MRALPVVERHPSLRWSVPLAGLGVVAVLLVNSVGNSPTGTQLPVLSVAQLVSQMRSGAHPQFSGTVVTDLSDGAGALAAVSPETSLAAMQAGTHSLRFWYGGPKRQRVAVVGALAETDVFRVGKDMWQWSSADRTAVHSRVPSSTPAIASIATLPASLTPVGLGDDAVAAAGHDTTVSIAGGEVVADRPAYGLVLRPKTVNTLIDYVHIAVDGATKTPLAVQVYARGQAEPAIDVSFTSIRFSPQPASTFRFAPPQGTTVRDLARAVPHPVTVRTHGRGWTTVLCYRGTEFTPKRLSTYSATAIDPSTVQGGWGRGRLVQLPLLSVLVTNDGRVYAGAVAPHVLYAAAAK